MSHIVRVMGDLLSEGHERMVTKQKEYLQAAKQLQLSACIIY